MFWAKKFRGRRVTEYKLTTLQKSALKGAFLVLGEYAEASVLKGVHYEKIYQPDLSNMLGRHAYVLTGCPRQWRVRQYDCQI